MTSFWIRIFITASFLMQGFSGFACDHSAKKQEAVNPSHCHQSPSQKSKKSHHQNHSQASKKTSGSSAVPMTLHGSHKNSSQNCLMCQTGTCAVGTASILFPLIEILKKPIKAFVAVTNLPLYWRQLNLQQVPQILRPPLLPRLLPHHKNWQAFFSIFRN